METQFTPLTSLTGGALMRLAKYFAGAVAILLAIWVIIGEQITDASSNAVINTRLITLVSPISGFLNLKKFNTQLGSIFEPGEVISTISNPLIDNSILADLQQRLSILESDIVALSEVLTNSNTAINQIKHQLDGHTDLALSKNKNAIARLEDRIRLFEEVESARVKTNEAKLSIKSIQNLSELSRATENIASLRGVQSAILNGLFFGEELKDLQQLKRDLFERNNIRSENLIKIEALKRQITVLKNRIIEEKRIIKLRSEYILYSMEKSMLWTKDSNNGQFISTETPLFTLALCDRLIITLSVSSGVYNKLSVCQNALFVSDVNKKTYQSKIIRLAGSGASRMYKNVAIPPKSRDQDRFDVAIESEEIRNLGNKSCAVGTTGRVFFDRRPFDWIRDLIN